MKRVARKRVSKTSDTPTDSNVTQHPISRELNEFE